MVDEEHGSRTPLRLAVEEYRQEEETEARAEAERAAAAERAGMALESSCLLCAGRLDVADRPCSSCGCAVTTDVAAPGAPDSPTTYREAARELGRNAHRVTISWPLR